MPIFYQRDSHESRKGLEEEREAVEMNKTSNSAFNFQQLKEICNILRGMPKNMFACLSFLLYI